MKKSQNLVWSGERSPEFNYSRYIGHIVWILHWFSGTSLSRLLNMDDIDHFMCLLFAYSQDLHIVPLELQTE